MFVMSWRGQNAHVHTHTCTCTHEQTNKQTHQKQERTTAQARTYKKEHDGNIDEESDASKDMLVPWSLQCLGRRQNQSWLQQTKLNMLCTTATSRDTYHLGNDKVAVDTHHNDSYNPDDHSHDTTIG